MKKSIALLLLATTAGCSFQITGLDEDGGANADLASQDLALVQHDLAMADLTPPSPDLVGEIDLVAEPDFVTVLDATATPDLATVEDIALPDDMAMPVDLAMAVDMAMPADSAIAADFTMARDLTTPPDLTVIPDLTVLPDLAVPFVPTRVPPSALRQGTADLIVNTSINTQTRLIDGQPAPQGTFFNNDGTYSTLIVRNLIVPKTVTVSGVYPLIVVASDSITIAGTLSAAAQGATPGVGGYLHGVGPGKDGSGTVSRVGGSGAGYPFAGGASGFASCSGVNTPGALGGSVWGDAALMFFTGGSGGGNGIVKGACSKGSAPVGGAGGGAIQLTAANAVIVSGQLVAGGGGGGGGCLANSNSGSGGGGGSGGSLMIESVSVTVSGTIAANGGGGGGASYATIGGPGSDGKASTQAAPGGAGGLNKPNGAELIELRGGVGGTTGPGGASMGTTDCSNSGGGGGAPGRIYLRSRGPATLPGVISPPPNRDPNL